MNEQGRIAELERELAHARGMLRALQQREVDAVVAESSVTIVRLRETEAALRAKRADAERTERALGRERELWQRLVDAVPVMITIYNPDASIVYLNREVERVLGWTTEAARAVNIMEEIYPDPEYRAEVHAFMNSLAPGWRDFTCRARSGERVETSWSNIRLADNTGVGIGIDLRERLASEREHRTILQTAMDGFWIVESTSGRFLEVNDAYCRMSGYTREELLSMSISDVEANEQPDETAAHIKQVQDTGYDRFESRHRRKDGTVIHVEVASQHSSTRGDTIFVFIRDITERKRAEAEIRLFNLGLERRVVERTSELAMNEARMAALLENTEDLLWSSDTEYRLVTANSAFRRAVEIAIGRQLLAGESLVSRDFPPDELIRWRSFYDRCLAGEVFKVETPHPASPGERYIETSFNPIRAQDGTVVGVSCFGREITERRRATLLLESLNTELERRVQDRTRALEEANRELESFSYSVSHDLRAPLRHAQGFVEMLRREVGAGISEKASRYMDTVADATREMGELIDDLLSFSRMGRVDLREDTVELDAVAREAQVHAAADAQDRDIEWRFAPLPRVRGDRTMLRQVLVNLFDNAVKYTRREPHAVIEVGCTSGGGDEVTVFVKDNGVGFDPEYTHKLFGVFQRLHRADEFEGTGIGLATVRRIIIRHGGRVRAEGAPGQGATFYFTLKPAHAAGGGEHR